MPKKSNFQIVENTLGTITANAIRGLAREEAEDVIKGLREEVAGLVAKQAQNIEAAEAEGSPEAAKVADEGTKAVQAADQVVKEAKADPTPEKAAVAKEAVETAKEKVDKAQLDIEGMVRDHDHTLYGEEAGLVRRVAKLEEGQSGLSASVEGLWVSVRANAKAIAVGTTAGLARIARLTTAVFAAGVLIWLFVVMVSDSVTLGNSWQNGIGIPAIAAGLVYVIMAARLDGRGHRETPAEAQADAGVDIVRGGAQH